MSEKTDSKKMPLWLQSFLEFLWLGICMWLLIAVPFVLSAILESWSEDTWKTQFQNSGNFLLLAFGVPLDIYRQKESSLQNVSTSDIVNNVTFEYQGILSLVPLLFLIFIILMARQAGERLARDSKSIQLWQLPVSALIFSIVFGTSVSLLFNNDYVRSNIWMAMFIPAVPLLIGLLWGVRRKRGSWNKVIGFTPEKWVQTFYDRIAPIGKTIVLILSMIIGASAAVVTIMMIINWTHLASAFQTLNVDVSGAIALFLIQLIYLPNFIMGAASWISGAGVHLGSETVATPFTNTDTVVPLFPILSTIPTEVNIFTVVAPVIFILIGIIAGRWFARRGKTYLVPGTRYEKGPSTGIYSETKVVSEALSTGALVRASLKNALILALSMAVILILLGWLASGYMGYELMYYGPRAWYFGLFAGIELLVGVTLGQLLTNFSERRQYIEGKIYDLNPVVNKEFIQQEMREPVIVPTTEAPQAPPMTPPSDTHSDQSAPSSVEHGYHPPAVPQDSLQPQQRYVIQEDIVDTADPHQDQLPERKIHHASTDIPPASDEAKQRALKHVRGYYKNQDS